MTAETDDRPAVDMLDVARDWVERAARIHAHYARREAEEPGFGRIEAHIAGAGDQQYHAMQMAAYAAEVSLAEDVRRIADTLTVVPAERIVDAEIVDDDRPEDHWRDAREPDADAYREPGQ